MGKESAEILFDVAGPPPPAPPGPALDREQEAAGPDLRPLEGRSDPWQDRTTATEKGSILIFSKVEIRWNVDGGLVADTFLQLTNDYPDDVLVQLYFINGDEPLEADEYGCPQPGWNWVDVQILLTANEPTFWSALTGLPKGVSPFTVLDPGE